MTGSILNKSRSFTGNPGEYGVHDYEFQACKMVIKDGVSKSNLKIIENEITNQDRISSSHVVSVRKAIEAPD